MSAKNRALEGRGASTKSSPQDMVHRYQELLREDAELDERLRRLRVSTRRVLPVALAALCVTLFVVGAVERDWSGLSFAVLGIVGLLLSVAGFATERKILRRWSGAVGTVLSRRKTGRRSGVEIKYGFRASDKQVHLGRSSGGAWMPKEGSTLGIVYHSDDPSRNLPLSKFWFYEFHLPAHSSGEAQTIAAASQRELS